MGRGGELEQLQLQEDGWWGRRYTLSNLILLRYFENLSIQILSAFAVSFGPFAVGLSKGYTSPALASMQQSPSLPMDNATAAVVTDSMANLSITEQQGWK